MRYNVHAGHAAKGCGAVGAVGLIEESVEDRIIKDYVIKFLLEAGNEVFDCTCDNGTQGQILSHIVNKCNAHDVDLDISIHFNSGANRPYRDGVTTGSEVLCYNPKSTDAVNAAKRIVDKLNDIGFKNRGIKYRRDLYYLKNVKAPAVLVEVCFVDDGDDVSLYNSKKEAIGKAIAEGILGVDINPVLITPYPEKVENGVYRLYNPNQGEHFYTTSSNERDDLINKGWGYEGVTWLAPSEGDPVYRLYNPNSGRHHFTANEEEKNLLINAGWMAEGEAFKSGGIIKVYRLYNPNTGEHFFTPNGIEKANLIDLGWEDEGVALAGN